MSAMSLPTISCINREFCSVVPKIFGDNLSFAFICGSFATGYARAGSDIDMFVCLKHRNDHQEREFANFYMDCHYRHNLAPDMNDPGEIMSLHQLQSAIEYSAGKAVSEMVRRYADYEYMVWVDMLSSKHMAFLGDRKVMSQIQSQGRPLIDRWRRQLLSDMSSSSSCDPVADFKAFSFSALARRWFAPPSKAACVAPTS